MQIEIRLIEKNLQLTKFQIFQRTLLDFNGTVMIGNNKKNTENTIHQKSYLLYLPGKCGSSSVVVPSARDLRMREIKIK